jgi:hypothetical protein
MGARRASPRKDLFDPGKIAVVERDDSDRRATTNHSGHIRHGRRSSSFIHALTDLTVLLSRRERGKLVGKDSARRHH